MRTTSKIAILMVALGLGTACAPPPPGAPPNYYTTGGALMGAAAGAAVGHAIDPTGGALTGALGGALIGGAIGNNMDYQNQEVEYWQGRQRYDDNDGYAPPPPRYGNAPPRYYDNTPPRYYAPSPYESGELYYGQ